MLEKESEIKERNTQVRGMWSLKGAVTYNVLRESKSGRKLKNQCAIDLLMKNTRA